MAKLIGWALFSLNCKRSQGDICRALLLDAMEKTGEDFPDEAVACRMENCGLWESMEDAPEENQKRGE